MKTVFKFYLVCLTSICFVTFSSCDKDDDSNDTTKPVIDLLEPEEDATLKIGDEGGIHFDLELSDDVMLKSYKVDIHSNFDGHVHAPSLKATTEATVDFTFNKSWDIPGQKNADIHHHEIKIPANATPGDYHLMVYCTDAAGNEAYLARNIILSTEGGEEHEHDH
ncbi:MAG: DUF4625 domain-containing protein [Dysgonamonadaceae bacterium]|jgi:hypothetical protein|nr:DUF4625 domain-containing protein [Dysgonamonadaceae bacterium]